MPSKMQSAVQAGDGTKRTKPLPSKVLHSHGTPTSSVSVTTVLPLWMAEIRSGKFATRVFSILHLEAMIRALLFLLS